MSGNSQGDFLIDSSTGKIIVAKPLDRETTSSYTLGVSTTSLLVLVSVKSGGQVLCSVFLDFHISLSADFV